ncbi:MAG: YbaN family protein [Kosmotogaceae bacterium]|nr:YbaN family protein [Kosmotogaceae bacterium]
MKLKRILLLIAGSLFLFLGITGIILPLLPTTPFLLLAAFCYLRSSKKLYRWLICHKLFGAYIYSYLHFRAVRRIARNLALLLLWSTLTLTMILISNTAVTLILIGVGLAVSIHLLKLKILTGEMLEEVREGLKNPEIVDKYPDSND